MSKIQLMSELQFRQAVEAISFRPSDIFHSKTWQQMMKEYHTVRILKRHRRILVFRPTKEGIY